MTSYHVDEPRKHLSQKHQDMIFRESGLDPGVAAERGYETVKTRVGLLEFKKYQRRPGLRIPMYSPDGQTTSEQLRPDNPRVRDGKAIKYETAGGSECILDVHPRMQEEARRGDGDLYITEGVKKADALTSRGLCTVGIIGVWNWQRGGEMLPCWDHIRLDGRRVYVVFDSDVMVKPEVQLALERLVAALATRGAEVLAVYLPHAGDGKTGVDDYLVAGGTVTEMKMLARKYEPSDIGKIRLSKDARLRRAVGDLRRRWWDYDWARVVGTGERPNSMRGHSCRDAIKVAIDAATRGGKVVGDGVRFTLSARTWALRAATSKPTLLKSIAHMEAEGWIRRVPAERDKAASYVLLTGRANLYQVGSKATQGGKVVTTELHSDDIGGKDLRAPTLRWSAPTFERDGDRVVRGYIRRLGKINGSIIHRLEREGEMHINEVAEALRRRARDLRRRNLPKLEEAGVVEVSEAGDMVRLTEDWETALQRERELKGEIEAERRDKAKYQRQREAYRNRDKVKPSPHWANVGADGLVEDLQPADDPEPAEPEPTPEDDAAVRTVLDYIGRLGKIRLGLLEQCWLEDGRGNLAELRRAVERSGVRQMRLPEYNNAVFLYPPLEDRGAA